MIESGQQLVAMQHNELIDDLSANTGARMLNDVAGKKHHDGSTPLPEGGL